MSLILAGYAYSVYTRSVRMALEAKAVPFSYAEHDPFDPAQCEEVSALHPFGRVPSLTHGGFHLWETQAILDYVDASFAGPNLTPASPEARARMRQVMGITDNYVYGPLVRQAVSEALFEPSAKAGAGAGILAQGLAKAPVIFAALDAIAGEALVLNPDSLTLADCLLWPMLDYFSMIPEGAEHLALYPALMAWAQSMAHREVALKTAPDLSQLKGDLV